MELWPAWTILSLLIVCGIVLLFTVRRSVRTAPRSRALRVTLRVAGILLLLFAALFSDEEISVSADSPPELSPSKTYSARVIVQGPLWPLKTIVLLRRTGSLHNQVVYRGEGWATGGGEASPYLEWNDDTHLTVHIHGTDAKTPCRPPAGPVAVVCKAHDW